LKALAGKWVSLVKHFLGLLRGAADSLQADAMLPKGMNKTNFQPLGFARVGARQKVTVCETFC
jgi:hypothetical protein